MLRVLVADDEESIAQGLKNLINSFDLDLIVKDVVDNGVDALDYIKTKRPEIVIMDINMPLLNGLKVIEETRKLNLKTIFIIISGYDYFRYAQKAVELDVLMYLLKPLKIDEFKACLIRASTVYQDTVLRSTGTAPENDCSDAISCSIEYIKENYSDKDLSLDKVARKFYLSTSRLSRSIKDRTGLNFSEYLNNYRILISKTLLINEKDKMIVEVSDRVGYSSQHYFSKVFKKETGVSPATFRLEN